MTSRPTRRFVCTRHPHPALLDSPISDQKYKEYNKLRAKLAAPQTPSKPTALPPPTREVERTPRGPQRFLTSTPLKRKRELEVDAETIPQSPEFQSPQGPSVIGPTPQRDGIVLGLFDSLPEGTPSKRRAVLAGVELNVVQTPSRKLQTNEASQESRARGERTPQSAGKRRLLDQFITPKKRKDDEQGTPSSTLRGLATPAFLRRNHALSAIDEEDETTARPMPWKRRGLGRSLSSMIQAMRKDEDDRLDEEADIMREMEMEEQGIPIPRKAKVVKEVKMPEVQVEDSQADMPLGPDRGVESEDEDDEPELGRDGLPRKVWKKKGLKRQTRRVISKILDSRGIQYANARQCDPISPNRSQSRHCKFLTTQKMKLLWWQRRRPIRTQRSTASTRTTICLIMRATRHIRQRGTRR
jgi:hypothetical protein